MHTRQPESCFARFLCFVSFLNVCADRGLWEQHPVRTAIADKQGELCAAAACWGCFSSLLFIYFVCVCVCVRYDLLSH